MMRLKSHPHLYLREHVEQVQIALKHLFEGHSPTTITQSVEELSLRAAVLHDQGKVNVAFQEYIRDPANYRGGSGAKAHTPLSLLLTLWQSLTQGWDLLDALLLSLVVRGHHGRLATLPKVKIGQTADSGDLDQFATTPIVHDLCAQLSRLEHRDLTEAMGVSGEGIEDFLGDPKRSVRRAQKFLLNNIGPVWEKLSLDEKLQFRFRTQLVFSLLLEADKAFLAVSNPAQYLQHSRHLWEPDRVDQLIEQCEPSPISQRDSVRQEVMKEIVDKSHESVFNLTAPTGIGKTLLAATWALQLRKHQQEQHRVTPKIVVVLPFLAIIDQTVLEYQKLVDPLNVGDKSWVLPSHGLADRDYGQGLEEKTESFFIDTWRSEVIITTYDQFLMAIFDDRTRYQMRFHQLWDSLIILDEVQSLPSSVWTPLDRVLKMLTNASDTKALLMSATLPSIVSDSTPLLPNYPEVFLSFERYEMVFDLQPTILSDFTSEMVGRREAWISAQKRILITLNTRAAARAVFEALEDGWPTEEGTTPLYFITADVTPLDRRAIVEEIKQGKPCVVVSTQTVEAGVDIDMSYVIRDFAPWDSLVQIAGRCNRHGRSSRETVEVRYLVSETGSEYAKQIYNDVHLAVTYEIIKGSDRIKEEEVLRRSEMYFSRLSELKDSGQKYFEQYVTFSDRQPIHEVLRGKNRLSYTFLVLEQDPELVDEMKRAQSIHDRWERREAWRQLASRIANVAIEVWARPGFHPHQIADEGYGDTWWLRPGYYKSRRGLELSEAGNFL